MIEEVALDHDIARVVDLLEQIKRVNEMIRMHSKLKDGDFMAEQYERQKQQFVNELKKLLLVYDLSVEVRSQAA